VFVDGRRLDSPGNPQTWRMILVPQDAGKVFFEILQRSAIQNPAATRPARLPSGETGGLGSRVPGPGPRQAPQ